MNYKEFSIERIQEIQKIYASEGWSAYLNDEEKLKRAFLQSLSLYGAFDDNQLVGFIRCVGDGEHILLVQDLIVLPKYRQKGIENPTFSICLGTIQRCTNVPRRHYYNRRRSQLFLSTLRNEKIGRRANGILLPIRIFSSGIIRKQIPQRKTNEDRLFSFKSILIHRKGFDECIRYGIFAAIFSSFQFTSGFPKRRLSIMLSLSL